VTIDDLVYQGKWIDAYLRLCQGEDCEETLAEAIRCNVEGTAKVHDQVFINAICYTGDFDEPESEAEDQESA